MVNKDTKLFFSVSSNPGNFGALMYNAAFKELGINAIYKPLKWEHGFFAASFYYFINGMMCLDTFSGLSVSMPFKKEALDCCNYLDNTAENIGNINTIVRRPDDNLEGYNTDAGGFERAVPFHLEKAKNAVIFGKGAVANRIGYILKKYNISFFMTRQADNLNNQGIDWLINASPVGMDHVPDDIFKDRIVKNYKYVFDVVSKPKTKLIETANRLGLVSCAGTTMSLEQLCLQFEIYTGRSAPRDLFWKVATENNYV